MEGGCRNAGDHGGARHRSSDTRPAVRTEIAREPGDPAGDRLRRVQPGIRIRVPDAGGDSASDKLWKPGDLAGLVVAHAAFDLTQSRFSAPPDALSEIADSGNSGGAVIGPEIPDWRSRNLLETEVELRVDGGARVRTYCGEWRRDPLDVMAWLVSSLGRRNIGLEAGAFVLTGSVTEPQAIVPGSSAVATFGGAARVLMRVGDEA